VIFLKRDFQFIISERGFTYPFIVLIISLILIVLFKSIEQYKQDIIMTENHLEHLRFDTIVQMSLDHLKRDLSQDKELKNVFYAFPEGEANIKLHKLSKDEFLYELYITTKNNSKFDRAGYIRLKNDH